MGQHRLGSFESSRKTKRLEDVRARLRLLAVCSSVWLLGSMILGSGHRSQLEGMQIQSGALEIQEKTNDKKVQDPTKPGGLKEGAKRKDCLTSSCHQDYRKFRYSHAPVEMGRCQKCHKPEEGSTAYEAGARHLFGLVARDGELCLKCHESQAKKKHVHYPIQQDRCVSCHAPHGSDNPSLIRHKNIAANCFACHEEAIQLHDFVHSPVALGQCTVCHDPHSSPHPNQLVAEGPRLCFSCHTDMQELFASRKHIHSPAREDCIKCHDAHGGRSSGRLRREVPGLCLDCHEDIKERAEHSKVQHGALQDKKSCTICHDPHTSDYSTQLRKAPIEICLSCHDKSIVSKDRIIKDMRTFLAENKFQHGPIRDGDCGACHNAHGAEFPSLLGKAYPKGFYAPYKAETYELCFSCHEKSMAEDKVTEVMTSFRNGKTNLHFVHVNDAEKGRTCGACHDVHASKNPKHIVGMVPFGKGWGYEFRFELTKTGGTCTAACHVERTYDRLRPVENK